MKKEALSRPFRPEEIRTRKGVKGKLLSYVETPVVIARLNEACDAWSFEIIRHEVLQNEVIVVGKLTADGISKMAFGTAELSSGEGRTSFSIGDTLKAASSDALKKSASLLGIGLHLYGDGKDNRSSDAFRDEAQSTESMTPPVGQEPAITPRQLGTVQSIVRRRNIANRDFTGRLNARFGKSELHMLSKREASALLSELLEANGAHR